jgi:nucleoside-diphosphate-sugar epimerase
VRTAITGGTGFVGSHLVTALRERGDTVAALVRSPSRAAGLRTLGCHLVEGTLEDERALEGLVEDADVVFHVAGRVAARSEEEFQRVNRDGAARVAHAAVAAGVSRLVHVSSLAVTGPTVRGRPLDETREAGPLSAYGRSKEAGEAAVRASGAPFTILRPAAVYGSRDRAFLSLFRAARYGVVPLLGDGGQELSLVHATDLASALVAAAIASATLGRTYHVAHPSPTTQRDLAVAIGGAVGRRVRTVTLPARLVRVLLSLAGGLARAMGGVPFLDGDKARELLAPAWTCSSTALVRDAGWEARVPLGEGLAEAARYYRASGWL